jgi:hypothetical protein
MPVNVTPLHDRVLVSLNCVFDASLVPETCLEFLFFANLIRGFDSAS